MTKREALIQALYESSMIIRGCGETENISHRYCDYNKAEQALLRSATLQVAEELEKQATKSITTRDQCPHCNSINVEYSNYEWFCLDCGEQWDQYGQDTK